MSKPSEAQKRQIHDDILEKTQKAMQRAGFSRDKIARELYQITFSDISNYLQVDTEGSVKAISLDDLAKGASRAIKKIREKSKTLGADGIILENTLEFELYDKLDALKTAAAMLGMEKPKQVEHTGKDGGPIVHEVLHRELSDRVKDLEGA